MIKNIKILANSLSVKFKNKHQENFPNIWLRDHAKDEKNLYSIFGYWNSN